MNYGKILGIFNTYILPHQQRRTNLPASDTDTQVYSVFRLFLEGFPTFRGETTTSIDLRTVLVWIIKASGSLENEDLAHVFKLEQK